MQKGQKLLKTKEIVCLVLNVGENCIGSIFNDSLSSGQEKKESKFSELLKKIRTFNKAYLSVIRTILVVCGVVFLAVVGFAL